MQCFKILLSSAKIINVILLSVLIYFACGCSIRKKTSPLSNAFLDGVDVSKHIDKLPFDHAWSWKESTRGNYNAVFIPPVSTDFISESAWKDSSGSLIDSKEKFEKEVILIAEHFHKQLLSEINKIKSLDFVIAEKPGPKTATVSIAITELQFSRPAIHATGMLPVPGLGLAASEISYPHAAFALKITDSLSGELIATIADRKFPPARLIDFNKLTVTSSIKEICGNWAQMLAETFYKGHISDIEERGSISILPW